MVLDLALRGFWVLPTNGRVESVSIRNGFVMELRQAVMELRELASRVNGIHARYGDWGHEAALSRVRRVARNSIDMAGELWAAEQIEAAWKEGDEEVLT